MAPASAFLTLRCIDSDRFRQNKPVDDELLDRKFTLTPRSHTVLIGRSSPRHSLRGKPQSSNALFSSPVVSRRHAELWFDPTTRTVYIKDLGSMHGTSVNGVPLERMVNNRLRPDSIITIGSNVIQGDKEYRARSYQVGCAWSEVSGHKTNREVSQSESVNSSAKGPNVQSMSQTTSGTATTFKVPDYDSENESDRGSEGVQSDAELEDDEPDVQITGINIRGRQSGAAASTSFVEHAGSSQANPFTIDDDTVSSPPKIVKPTARTYIALADLFNDDDVWGGSTLQPKHKLADESIDENTPAKPTFEVGSDILEILSRSRCSSVSDAQLGDAVLTPTSSRDSSPESEAETKHDDINSPGVTDTDNNPNDYNFSDGASDVSSEVDGLACELEEDPYVVNDDSSCFDSESDGEQSSLDEEELEAGPAETSILADFVVNEGLEMYDSPNNPKDSASYDHVEREKEELQHAAVEADRTTSIGDKGPFVAHTCNDIIPTLAEMPTVATTSKFPYFSTQSHSIAEIPSLVNDTQVNATAAPVAFRDTISENASRLHNLSTCGTSAASFGHAIMNAGHVQRNNVELYPSMAMVGDRTPPCVSEGFAEPSTTADHPAAIITPPQTSLFGSVKTSHRPLMYADSFRERTRANAPCESGGGDFLDASYSFRNAYEPHPYYPVHGIRQSPLAPSYGYNSYETSLNHLLRPRLNEVFNYGSKHEFPTRADAYQIADACPPAVARTMMAAQKMAATQSLGSASSQQFGASHTTDTGAAANPVAPTQQKTSVDGMKSPQAAPTSLSKVSIASIVDPQPPAAQGTLCGAQLATGPKRKAHQISTDETTATAAEFKTSKESTADLSSTLASLSVVPAITTAVVTEVKTPIAQQQPPRKKARFSAAGPFALGVLVGGVGILGALVSLPESLF